MNREDFFSKKVTTVMLLMSILVLLIHNNNLMLYGYTLGDDAPAAAFEKLICTDLSGQAVHVFFFLSGALFFRFDLWGDWRRVLREKLGRRVRSIVLPYLVWNCIYTGIYIILRPGERESAGMLAWNLLEGIFLGRYCFFYWFIKNLMVLLLLSPVLAVVLRRKYLCMAVLLPLAADMAFDLVGDKNLILETTSLFYYLLGGWMMQYRREFLTEPGPRPKLWLLAWIAGVLFSFLTDRWVTVQCLLSVGMPLILWRGLEPVEAIAAHPFARYTFVIYSLHPLVVSLWRRLLAMLCPANAAPDGWIIASFLAGAVLSIATIYLICMGILARSPRLRTLLNGGRSGGSGASG